MRLFSSILIVGSALTLNAAPEPLGFCAVSTVVNCERTPQNPEKPCSPIPEGKFFSFPRVAETTGRTDLVNWNETFTSNGNNYRSEVKITKSKKRGSEDIYQLEAQVGNVGEVAPAKTKLWLRRPINLAKPAFKKNPNASLFHLRVEGIPFGLTTRDYFLPVLEIYEKSAEGCKPAANLE